MATPTPTPTSTKTPAVATKPVDKELSLGDEVKVKTTGAFMLQDPNSGDEFEFDSKGETYKVTQFILDKLEQKQLEIVK